MKKAIAGVAVAIIVALLLVVRVLSESADPRPQTPARRVLRVCADPNNLPYSNGRAEGFENRIAEILARDLNADLEYVWWAQRRGSIRNTLRAHACDVIIGTPAGMDMLLVTAPYYRSGYVFVTRKDSGLNIESLDSPLLRRLSVGVQLIGDDGANSPPAHALARRGIIANVRGFRAAGDYSQPNPPARIIEAVASGDIDVAIAWGPLAGYFSRRQSVPLVMQPVSPQIDLPFLPFVYDISIGVRQGEDGLRQQLEMSVARNRHAIDRVLREYGVPRMDLGG